MYAELSSAVASAKAALELAQAAKGLANFNELVAAVSEVNTKLMAAYDLGFAAQEKLLGLTEQIALLKTELAQIKEIGSGAEDYTLANIGAGVFAYVYTPQGAGNKPKHLACIKSFTEHRIGILQDEHRVYRCALCSATISPITNGGKTSLEQAYEHCASAVAAQ